MPVSLVVVVVEWVVDVGVVAVVAVVEWDVGVVEVVDKNGILTEINWKHIGVYLYECPRRFRWLSRILSRYTTKYLSN